jgi:hypothetical protein
MTKDKYLSHQGKKTLFRLSIFLPMGVRQHLFSLRANFKLKVKEKKIMG